MAEALHRPNDLERHAIDQKSATYGGTAGEQDAYEFFANDADVVALLFVVPVQPAPLVDGLVSNVVELRLRAIHVAVAAAVLAHQTKVAAVDHRRGFAHVGRVANVDKILIVQVVLARRKLAAAYGRNPAVVDLHVIFAEEARQILLGSRAKTLT